MSRSTVIIFGAALLAYAFTRLPEKYRPAWARRFTPWQVLLGVVGIVMAVAIVLNPEILALGILGDTAFFDLLVLAIGLQLQTVLGRAWEVVATWFARMRQRIFLQTCFEACCVVIFVSTSVGAVQKAVQRVLS